MVGVAAARHEATPRRVPRALILGTVVPLAMALALALASSNLPGADPLSPLLKRGGMDALILRMFAASAVATTVIGLLLAASQLLSDVVCGFVGWCSERDQGGWARYRIYDQIYRIPNIMSGHPTRNRI